MRSRFNLLRWVLMVILLALISYKVKQELTPYHARLVSPNDDVRNIALARLPKLLPEKIAQLEPQLVKSLESPEPKVRKYALYAIRQIRTTKPETMKQVIAKLSDPDANVREEAQLVILEGGEAVFVLSSILALPPVDMRKMALRMLSRLGKEAGEAKTAIEELFHHSDPALRAEAALAYVKIVPPGAAAKPILIENLRRDPWDAVSYQCANALALMGTEARSAIPELEDALTSGKDGYLKGPYQRAEAAKILSKIDPRPQELENLRWDLSHKNAVIRYRAAYSLSEMPANKGAVPILISALGDPDVPTAARVMVALVRIGLENTERKAQEAYPAMLRVLGKVQKAKNLEGFNEAVVPALVQLGQPLIAHIEAVRGKRLLNAATAQALLDQIQPK